MRRMSRGVGATRAMLSDQADSDERDRSGLFWILAAILLLLLLLGLGWFWWKGGKSAPSAPPTTQAAAVMVSPAKTVDTPAGSYDVVFGYHQATIRTSDAVTGAFAAWRAANDRQCGQARSCRAEARIDVVGHADRRTGTPAFNTCIAWKRATVVADALVDLGAPRRDVAAEFVGAADIAAPEADEASAAKHRHASISIVTGNAPASSCNGICRSSLSASEAARCEAKLKEPPLLHLSE